MTQKKEREEAKDFSAQEWEEVAGNWEPWRCDKGHTEPCRDLLFYGTLSTLHTLQAANNATPRNGDLVTMRMIFAREDMRNLVTEKRSQWLSTCEERHYVPCEKATIIVIVS